MLKVSQHVIDADDEKAVLRALHSGVIARGKETQAFEEEFADYVEAKYAVSCSSGTAALWMACQLAESTPLPVLNFCAAANAVHYQRRTPFFYDNFDPGQRGHNNMIVHFAGSAYRTRDALIEDACHALGARYTDGQRIGSCPESVMTCFSFHPSKHITTGEGGMVTTNDQDVYLRLLSLRDNGRERLFSPVETYAWTGAGLNYHITEMGAALGRSQLQKAREWLRQRRNLGLSYFCHLPKAAVPVLERQNNGRDSYHIFPVSIDFEGLGKSREYVVFEMLRRGIETQVHYRPLHLQPAGGGSEGDFPHAESYYKQALTLPLHVGMDPKDVSKVCNALAEILDG